MFSAGILPNDIFPSQKKANRPGSELRFQWDERVFVLKLRDPQAFTDV